MGNISNILIETITPYLTLNGPENDSLKFIGTPAIVVSTDFGLLLCSWCLPSSKSQQGNKRGSLPQRNKGGDRGK